MIEITEMLSAKMIEVERKVIDDVLHQLLKRKPTEEDYKNTQRYQQEGIHYHYYLAYNNLKLGKVFIENKIVNGNFSVRFEPFGMDDFLEPATIGNKVTF